MPQNPTVVKRPPRNYAYTVGLLLSSGSTTTVTETSHSVYGLTKVIYPPRTHIEL